MENKSKAIVISNIGNREFLKIVITPTISKTIDNTT